MDTSGELDEGEEPEEEMEAPRRRIGRRKLLAILVAVLLVAGVGSYFAFFSNQPPVAAFTYSAVDKKLTVSADTSHDPDGRIASYTWNWGDGTTGNKIRDAHTYAQEGQFSVKLTVTDDRGAQGSQTESITIIVRPTADFDVDVDKMAIAVDGSLSYSETGGAITSWSWGFGDGTTATGIRALHTYLTPGRRAVSLSVTDASGRVGNVSRYVSPATTTVDVKVSDAFTAACPYESYWPWRYQTYGDVLIHNSPPCIDYYPWVLFTDAGDINPSFLYTLYHRVSKVRNHPGYSVTDPVILPVNNSAILPDPGSYIRFNISLEYMGQEWKDRLNNTPYSPNLFGDGFDMLLRGNFTMDLTMTKRIFGVPATATAAQAQSWWWANTGYARSTKAAESALSSWLDIVGNGKYNIWEGFEWELVVDLIDLNATVAPDGTTTIQNWWMVYGLDALFMRFWFWGKADYSAAVAQPYSQIQPEGWAPEELCWCENARMVGNITDHLDLDYSADAAYEWMAWANKGPDLTWNTPDDQPAWVYAPVYLDYVPSSSSPSPGAGKYYTSELSWWEGKTSIHASPGSYSYGKPYEYLVAPTRFLFNPGYTLTIRMPRGNVPWYDPVQSTWNPATKIGNYVANPAAAPMTLRFVSPAGNYYLWDPRTKVLSFAGPFNYPGETGAPVLPEPWVEMQPEAA